MPEQSAKFAKVAAQLEIRENRWDNAATVLCSLPLEKLDFDAAVMMVGILEYLTTTPKMDELTNKLDAWINRSKQTEGETVQTGAI